MITFRSYLPKDRQGVLEILYRTGYMGEDASDYFDDKCLLGLLFGLYYLDYEPENCFVAINTLTEEIVGYILCSLDTTKQEKKFKRKMVPRVALRAFLYTSWRYRKSFHVLLHLMKINQNSESSPDEKLIFSEYPAHLHINVLPGYHRQGIGAGLLIELSNHLMKKNVKGIHLWTSERNEKAVPFYLKNGFKLLYTSPTGIGLWPNAKDVKSLAFGKKM